MITLLATHACDTSVSTISTVSTLDMQEYEIEELEYEDGTLISADPKQDDESRGMGERTVSIISICDSIEERKGTKLNAERIRAIWIG